MLLLRLAGSFLFRLAERTFLPLLIQEPPRNTRSASAITTLNPQYNAKGEAPDVACAKRGCRRAD